MVNSSVIEEIDNYISQLIQDQNCIGFNLVINDKGKSYIKSYGKLAVDEDIICDPETLFAIGSLSKSFTCLSILILEHQDKLSIEDPISKYLPLNLDGREDKILIRHLMTHSSGLPDLYICAIIEANVGLRDDYNKLDIGIKFDSWEDVFNHISGNKEFISKDPGERFHYSDISFTLLQYIIEKSSEMSYFDFMKKEIFSPLDMDKVTVRSQYNGQKSAFGHLSLDQSSQKFRKTSPNYPGNFLIDGGGGIMASAKSMSNYLEYMIDGGKFKGKQLISEKRFAEMTSSQMVISESRGFYYGYGWMILKNTNFGEIVFHLGHTGSVTSGLGFVQKDKIGLYHSNNYSVLPFPIFMKLFSSVMGDRLSYDQDLPFYKELQDYTGNYEGPLGLEKLKFCIEDDHAKLHIKSVGVYTVLIEDYVLHFDTNSHYYIVMNGLKTKVDFEIFNDTKFISIAKSKFRYIS